MPLLLALALLVAVVVGPNVASAHAAYKSSEPADGATVASPPPRVTAEFTEPLGGTWTSDKALPAVPVVAPAGTERRPSARPVRTAALIGAGGGKIYAGIMGPRA